MLAFRRFLFSLRVKRSSVWLQCRKLTHSVFTSAGREHRRRRWSAAGDYGLDKPEMFNISGPNFRIHAAVVLGFFSCCSRKQNFHRWTSEARGYKSSNNAAGGKKLRARSGQRFIFIIFLKYVWLPVFRHDERSLKTKERFVLWWNEVFHGEYCLTWQRFADRGLTPTKTLMVETLNTRETYPPDAQSFLNFLSRSFQFYKSRVFTF